MTQRYYWDPIVVEHSSDNISIDDLVNGKAFSLFKNIFIGDDYDKQAKRTLIDHLIFTKNINHSLSWYLTLPQALSFGRMIDAGNQNHTVERELVKSISTHKVFDDKIFKMLDIGSGTGDNGIFIMKLLRESTDEIIFTHYFPVDGSPYFVGLSLENFAKRVDIDLIGSISRVTKLLPQNDLNNLLKIIDNIEYVLSADYRDIILQGEEFDPPALSDLFKQDPKYEGKDEFNVWSSLCNNFSTGDEIERRLILNRIKKYYFKQNLASARKKTYPWAINDLKDLTERIGLMYDRGVIYEHFNELGLIKTYSNMIMKTFEKPSWTDTDVARMGTCFDVIRFLFGSYEIDNVWPFRDGKETQNEIEFSCFVGDILNPNFIGKIGFNVRDRERTFENKYLSNKSNYLTLFLGNTLGNFSSDQRNLILNHLSDMSEEDNYVFIGVELRPREDFENYRLECDEIANKYQKEGVKFLAKSVELLGVDPSKLTFNAHYVYPDSKDLIELGFEPHSVGMFYFCNEDVTFTDGEREVKFDKGDIIPAGSSYKFSPGKLDDEGNYGKTELEELCENVGFEVVGHPAIHANKQGNPDYMVLMVKK